MRYVSTGWLAAREGVTTQTIRRWIAAGKYENVKYTPNGQARIGVTVTETVGYVRVSSKKQEKSLEKQEQEILRSYPGINVVRDIGSGFNFKRRGLKALLERCMRGDPIHIVVSDRDRLARAGYDVIDYVVRNGGGAITVLNSSGEKHCFDTEQLVGFITSFCNSYYGKRSARRKKDQDLP